MNTQLRQFLPLRYTTSLTGLALAIPQLALAMLPEVLPRIPAGAYPWA